MVDNNSDIQNIYVSNRVSVDSDNVIANFNDGLTNEFAIGNFTSYRIERDFFVAADAFHMTIEDDRAYKIRKDIVIGSPITILINGKIQLKGFIEKVNYSYARQGKGSVLQISGRDSLGLMSDAITPPNNYFNANSTIKEILVDLFSEPDGGFGLIVDEESLSDATQLKVNTAGEVGIRTKGKTGKARASSWNRQIQRQVKPRKEESYLKYIERICKEIGCNIKMLAGTNKVYINTPIYDRTQSPPYLLVNTQNIQSAQNLNNIISGDINVNWQKQPSIIISEMAGSQQPEFRRNIAKVIQINELVCFDSQGNIYQSVYDQVQLFAKTYGYNQVDVNQNLIQSLPGLVEDQFDTVGNISRPMYLFDEHATTVEELEFMTLQKMAEHQKEFLKLEYIVKDHTFNGIVWNCNLMTTVIDDHFGINGQQYWIEKVVFSKDRHSGTTTHLTLSLPYIFNYYTYDIEQAQTNATPKNISAKPVGQTINSNAKKPSDFKV